MKSLTRRSAKTRRSGFTLLELLIVLAIIVAIAAMVAPNLLSSQNKANIQTTRATIKTIEDAFKRRAVNMNGVYEEGSGPEFIDKLAEPYEDSDGQQQPPELEDIPVDPWNNKYQYSYNSGDLKPKIWSFGPDKKDDGGNATEDISNERRVASSGG